MEELNLNNASLYEYQIPSDMNDHLSYVYGGVINLKIYLACYFQIYWLACGAVSTEYLFDYCILEI